MACENYIWEVKKSFKKFFLKDILDISILTLEDAFLLTVNYPMIREDQFKNPTFFQNPILQK